MVQLVVVSASWCEPCRLLKERLRALQIPFKVVDVGSRSGARRAAELGVASVPAVFVKTGDRHIRVTNPTVTTIRAALERHEEPACTEFS